MPKSKYKYYKSIINGALYRPPVKNTKVLEGYVENRGWILLEGIAYPTLTDPRQSSFVTEITEYEALHIDMFKE